MEVVVTKISSTTSNHLTKHVLELCTYIENFEK